MRVDGIIIRAASGWMLRSLAPPGAAPRHSWVSFGLEGSMTMHRRTINLDLGRSWVGPEFGAAGFRIFYDDAHGRLI